MTPEAWCPPADPPETDPPCTFSISSLCEMGWRPLLITGMLRNMLTEHFADERSIADEALHRYVWRPGDRSGILIESVHAWKPRHVEKRPAILVRRNTMAGLRFVLNDLSGLTGQGDGEHFVCWVGSHTLFCLHGGGASVEILATEVQRLITGFAPAIRRNLGLLKWAVTEYGAIGELEEAAERFAVPITVGWAYLEKFRLANIAHPVRRLPLSIVLECPLTGGRTPFVVPTC